MCFKNLPIDFDEKGKTRLKHGVADPYSLNANGGKKYTKELLDDAPDVVLVGAR